MEAAAHRGVSGQVLCVPQAPGRLRIHDSHAHVAGRLYHVAVVGRLAGGSWCSCGEALTLRGGCPLVGGGATGPRCLILRVAHSLLHRRRAVEPRTLQSPPFAQLACTMPLIAESHDDLPCKV